MKKLKIVTIIGTRPEIIRLSLIIKKCDEYFDQVLIHTGQNYDYELNEIFFNELEIRKPDYFFEVASQNLGDTLGNIISKSYEILNKIKPDALLVLGDTNSSLSVLPAKRLKIPIFQSCVFFFLRWGVTSPKCENNEKNKYNKQYDKGV